MKKMHGILVVWAICLLTAAMVAPLLAGNSQHPLRNTKVGTWLEYNFKSAFDPGALKAAKCSSRWWNADHITEDFLSVKFETFVFGQRRPGGNHIFHFDRPFEPTLKDVKGVKIKVLSEGNETLTINGKSYKCKWQMRQIDLAMDEQTVTPEYKCKSKVWYCADVPMGGMVRMENDISQRFSKGEEFMKVYEFWELKAFGQK